MRIMLILVLCSCSVASAATAQDSLARDVTIYRDTYGVPHVFGRTDASTVFGFAYAQAEDNFWRVEENFINALGRASELYGNSPRRAKSYLRPERKQNRIRCSRRC